MKISILIVDDHAIVRTGLKSLLGTESDFTVVPTTKGGRTRSVRRAREM